MRCAWSVVAAILVSLPGSSHPQVAARGRRASDGTHMVAVRGGTWRMGDWRSEGDPAESPSHRVTVSDFELGATEITVGQFRKFVDEAGYRTSAEAAANRAVLDSLTRLATQSPDLSPQERRALVDRTLLFGGCGWWNATARGFEYDETFSWRKPGFEQTEEHPAVCLSWEDAASYANWVSRLEGLPPAYDVAAGTLLDGDGRPTTDITAVPGYRLPTEAEWEYAAREGGREVRFGTGLDQADPSTSAFDASTGAYAYQTPGPLRFGTEPVASYPANALGVYDLAGNAWEWVSDWQAPYTDEAVTNPYQAEGRGRGVRGGRWGGNAEEMRTTKRFAWQPKNRCNASGFRLARSRAH